MLQPESFTCRSESAVRGSESGRHPPEPLFSCAITAYSPDPAREDPAISSPIPPAAPQPDAPSGSHLKRSSIQGFLWGTAAWGSNRLVVLGLTLFLARVLLPADFGVVTAALTVIAILDAALDLGVGAAIVTRQEQGITERTRIAVTLSILISAVIAGAGVAASPLLASLFHAPDHTEVFALIFLYPLFRGMGQISDALLKRDLEFRRRTVVDVTRALVRAAVSIPLALTIGGALSIAVGLIAAEVAATLVLWAFRPVVPSLRLRRETVADLLGFGGQVTVIRVFGSFRSTFDYVVVGAALGATALGFYGMAYKLPELVIENVLWIFTMVALPTYARALAQGRDVLMSAMLRATRLVSTFGLVAGVTLAVLARDAMPLLFSPQWTPAVVPMILISISLGFMSIAWASGDVFTAMGRPGTLLGLDIPATVLMGAGFVVATRFGLIGVASVHLIFNVLYCVARLALLQRVTRVGSRRLAAAILPGLAVAGATALAGFGARALLPEGQWGSLVVLAAICAATALCTAAIVARSTLRELAGIRAVLARRRGVAPVASEALSNG